MRSNLSSKELATVLAALRYWQAKVTDEPDGGQFSDFFVEDGPLSLNEIDSLCEKLNRQ